MAERVGRYPLVISTIIVAVITAVVIAIAHILIGDVFGGIPDGFQVDTFSGEQDLEFYSSVTATLMYVVVGGLVYALVRRFASDYDRVFVIVATVVTVLSCLQPLMLDAPNSVKFTLVVLHLIAGAVATAGFLRLTRPKSAS